MEEKWPIWDDEDIESIVNSLKSGKWCRLYEGSVVEKFEKEFAKFQDAKYGIATSNGTVSIQLALRTLGVKAGDEVIVPAITFIATASAVAEIGAIPVFADIILETGQIDPESVKEKITERTKGVIAVHYGGYPADLDSLLSLCKEKNLFLIEDCAHAHGTKWKGKGVGAIGDIGSFSFQASKSLATGEGGIILTDSEELYEKAKLIHNIGRVLGKPGYLHFILSSNYRMPEIIGALGLTQLKKLKNQIKIKEENFKYLKEEMKNVDEIEFLKDDERITQRGFYYVVMRYKGEVEKKKELMENLEKEGYPVFEGYGVPLYKNPAFEKEALAKIYPEEILNKLPDYKSLYLPNSEKFCQQQIVLPQWFLLLERKEIHNFVERLKSLL